MHKLLMESTFVQELTGKKWKVRIIKGDTQGTSAFYKAEMLEAHADVVKAGTRVFADHISVDERPERSVHKLVGHFSEDSYYENGDLYGNIEVFSDYVDWVKERASAGVIGLSIHGSGEKYEENGVVIAGSIDAIHSVDIVTVAGAGGEFLEMVESQSQEQEVETNMELELPKELLEALDVQNQSIQGLITAVTEMKEVNDKLLESQEVEEGQGELEEAGPSASDIAEALLEAGLTKAGRTAVYAAVDAGTELEEAIANEKARETEILEESRPAVFGTVDAQTKTNSENLGSVIFG